MPRLAMKFSCAVVVVALVAALGVSRAAFGQSFTDDPLTVGTPIKAVHITELRTAIANLRVLVGLPVFTFTDSITPAVTIRAVHVAELRNALNDVFDAAGLLRPGYTDASLPGALIKAAHIQELRNGTVTVANAIAACAGGSGALSNGTTHCGAISGAGETDTWTFTATAGDRIGVHIGQITDANDFRPWIRLVAPNAVTLGNAFGVDATFIDVTATVTGTYQVLAASADPGFDGTGTYRLTMTHTPGPITVASGDDGGPLTNGATHVGRIPTGDLDVWTFTATAGDRIGVHIGQASEADDFRPWIRLWGPNGVVGGDAFGVDGTYIDVSAAVSGTYLVLVASADPGVDGEGTYQLTMTHTPGPITISPGDQGGPLDNGALHTGEITQGDLDVWTFTATAGDRIGLHVGQVSETDDFRPWIRLWGPNGAVVGDAFGVDGTYIDQAAAVSGTYLVLVASADPGYDGEGTYQLTMTHTPGPITISPGDQGGPLTNGALHTGEITQGDLDVWTFTATAGDRIGIHVGQVSETDDFRPWIRLWGPNGAVVGDAFGVDGTYIDQAAAVSGTYLVLVASADPGYDGEGTYRLTMTHTPGPITISPGDQGGPLDNGALHTGEITQGDLDVWTFTATAGDRIAVHVGQVFETDDFRPWIRLWGPNGAVVGDAFGTEATYIDQAAAVSGTYLVLVASADPGYDGEGTYRLTMTHTPGPITVTPGDEGGALTNGAPTSGEILQGDLDVWTITVPAGNRITVTISQTTETDDFRPWIRLWAPNGVVSGSAFGTDAAQILNAVAPASGTYLVLVSSADPGYNGTGTYQLTVTHVPPPSPIDRAAAAGASVRR